MSSGQPVRTRRSSVSRKKPNRKKSSDDAAIPASFRGEIGRERDRKLKTTDGDTCLVTPMKTRRRSSESTRCWHQQGGVKMSSRSVVDPSVTPVCKICQQPAQPWAELLWYENKDKEYRIAEVEGSTSGIWLHKLCTQWSEGIKEMDENRVIGVDAVVERSRKESCCYCLSLGASVVCRLEQCQRRYHSLCVSRIDAFVDVRTRTLCCGEHLPESDLYCMVCHQNDHTVSLLHCVACNRVCHSKCTGYQRPFYFGAYTSWRCTDCRICPLCRKSSDIRLSVMCSACCKSYHRTCINYKRSLGAAAHFRCQTCLMCTDCGLRLSPRWYDHHTRCESCFHRRRRQMCVLCQQPCKKTKKDVLVACLQCSGKVHSSCLNSNSDNDTSPTLDFICPDCLQTLSPADFKSPTAALPINGSSPDKTCNDISNTSDPFVNRTSATIEESTQSHETEHEENEDHATTRDQHSPLQTVSEQTKTVDINQSLKTLSASIDINGDLPHTNNTEELDPVLPVCPASFPDSNPLVSTNVSDKLVVTSENSVEFNERLPHDVAYVQIVREDENSRTSFASTNSDGETSHDTIDLPLSSVKRDLCWSFDSSLSANADSNSEALLHVQPVGVKRKAAAESERLVLDVLREERGREALEESEWVAHQSRRTQREVTALVSNSGERKKGLRMKNVTVKVSGAAKSSGGGIMLPLVASGAEKDAQKAVGSLSETAELSQDHMPTVTVLVSSTDAFFIEQDICRTCGSIGCDSDHRFLSCSQCGQCYHPYCVKINVSKVLLQRGWRCLDCTVCEGCGHNSDEANLLLCEDCDVSYHTYCLTPRLKRVPDGAWRCHLCVVCRSCGVTDPGLRCQWESNYTQCGPCASRLHCPVCKSQYSDGQLLLRCEACVRWMHAACDGYTRETDVETVSDSGYHCLFCRPVTKHVNCVQPRGLYGPLRESAFKVYAAVRRRLDEQDGQERRDTEQQKEKDMAAACKRLEQMLVRTATKKRGESTEKQSSKDGVAILDELKRIQAHLKEVSETAAAEKVVLDVTKPTVHLITKSTSLSHKKDVNQACDNGMLNVTNRRARSMSPLSVCVDLQLGVVNEDEMKRQRRHSADSHANHCENAVPSWQQLLTENGRDDVVHHPFRTVRTQPLCLRTAYNRDAVIDGSLRERTIALKNLYECLSQQSQSVDASGHSISREDEHLFQFAATALGSLMTSSTHSDYITPVMPPTSETTSEPKRRPRRKVEKRKEPSNSSVGTSNDCTSSQPIVSSELSVGPRRVYKNKFGESVSSPSYDKKWQEDEERGHLATLGAVLYANVEKPELKEKFKEWPDRLRVINRLWRHASSDVRLKYVCQARVNRTKLAADTQRISHTESQANSVKIDGGSKIATQTRKEKKHKQPKDKPTATTVSSSSNLLPVASTSQSVNSLAAVAPHISEMSTTPSMPSHMSSFVSPSAASIANPVYTPMATTSMFPGIVPQQLYHRVSIEQLKAMGLANLNYWPVVVNQQVIDPRLLAAQSQGLLFPVKPVSLRGGASVPLQFGMVMPRGVANNAMMAYVHAQSMFNSPSVSQDQVRLAMQQLSKCVASDSLANSSEPMRTTAEMSRNETTTESRNQMCQRAASVPMDDLHNWEARHMPSKFNVSVTASGSTPQQGASLLSPQMSRDFAWNPIQHQPWRQQQFLMPQKKKRSRKRKQKGPTVEVPAELIFRSSVGASQANVTADKIVGIMKASVLPIADIVKRTKTSKRNLAVKPATITVNKSNVRSHLSVYVPTAATLPHEAVMNKSEFKSKSGVLSHSAESMTTNVVETTTKTTDKQPVQTSQPVVEQLVNKPTTGCSSVEHSVANVSNTVTMQPVVHNQSVSTPTRSCDVDKKQREDETKREQDLVRSVLAADTGAYETRKETPAASSGSNKCLVVAPPELLVDLPVARKSEIEIQRELAASYQAKISKQTRPSMTISVSNATVLLPNPVGRALPLPAPETHVQPVRPLYFPNQPRTLVSIMPHPQVSPNTYASLPSPLSNKPVKERRTQRRRSSSSDTKKSSRSKKSKSNQQSSSSVGQSVRSLSSYLPPMELVQPSLMNKQPMKVLSHLYDLRSSLQGNYGICRLPNGEDLYNSREFRSLKSSQSGRTHTHLLPQFMPIGVPLSIGMPSSVGVPSAVAKSSASASVMSDRHAGLFTAIPSMNHVQYCSSRDIVHAPLGGDRKSVDSRLYSLLSPSAVSESVAKVVQPIDRQRDTDQQSSASVSLSLTPAQTNLAQALHRHLLESQRSHGVNDYVVTKECADLKSKENRGMSSVSVVPHLDAKRAKNLADASSPRCVVSHGNEPHVVNTHNRGGETAASYYQVSDTRVEQQTNDSSNCISNLVNNGELDTVSNNEVSALVCRVPETHGRVSGVWTNMVDTQCDDVLEKDTETRSVDSRCTKRDLSGSPLRTLPNEVAPSACAVDVPSASVSSVTNSSNLVSVSTRLGLSLNVTSSAMTLTSLSVVSEARPRTTVVTSPSSQQTDVNEGGENRQACCVPEETASKRARLSDDESTLSPVSDCPRSINDEFATVCNNKDTHSDSEVAEPLPKRKRTIKWCRWRSFMADMKESKKAVTTESTDLGSDMERLWNVWKFVLPSSEQSDRRACVLCRGYGDGNPQTTSRLLTLGINEWVHLNCCLWSREVYETIGGALKTVGAAVKRAKLTTCTVCNRLGASLECYQRNCGRAYHFHCAVETKCSFYEDKTVFCSSHKTQWSEDLLLKLLNVERHVFTERNERQELEAVVCGDTGCIFRIGSVVYHSIGQLSTKMQKFHTETCIYPIGYKATRFYWSMTDPHQRCRYQCAIHDVEGEPEFVITVQDRGRPDYVIKSNSPMGAWSQVLEPIRAIREKALLLKLFPEYITGEYLFGLTEPSVVQIIEAMPGIDHLPDYKCSYLHRTTLPLPLPFNPSGSARTEASLWYTLRGRRFRARSLWSTARQTQNIHKHGSESASQDTSASSSGSNQNKQSPYLKQFVKAQEYRRLKQEWLSNVELGRSLIQGLGLFAKRDMDKYTMVIEYKGLVIRNEVANKREKIYEDQRRGCYMFRIDAEQVIDATLHGGLARYINHACEPNCVAEVVEFEKEKKIIIISNRYIKKGEELTYDYKFEFEAQSSKIPCNCGAPSCRKWMN